MLNEAERGETGDAGEAGPESTPEQVARFLYDATGRPMAPSGTTPLPEVAEEKAGRLRSPEEARASHARHPSGMVPGDGDYVVDIHGRRLTPDEVGGMTDAKGRPLVIPRY